MTIHVSLLQIGGLDFLCAPLGEVDFSDPHSIYAILDFSDPGAFLVLDVGLGGAHGIWGTGPGGRRCWMRHCDQRKLWVGIYPMPANEYTEEDRLRCVRGLRLQYHPPCGTDA